MVERSDLVRVEVTDDMQRRAVAYALRSIHYTYDRMDYGQIGRRLPRIVAGIIAEEAVGAYFDNVGLAYEKSGRTHWRQIDVAEFVVGGKRADLKSYHVYPSSSRPIPEWLLGVEALVPVDQLGRQTEDHVSIQAFLLSPQVNSSERHSFAQCLPRSWADGVKTPRMAYLDNIADTGVGAIHVLGEDQEGDKIWHVKPGGPSEISACSLQAIIAPGVPSKVISIAWGAETTTLQPNAWRDLWMESPDLWLAGWASRDQYKAGKLVPVGSRTAVYTQGTRTMNRCLMVPDLLPMSLLR